MTETPVSVRATARVGGTPPPSTSAATVVPRRRPGYLGPVHVVQLMLVEAVIVGLLVLLGQGPVVIATGIVLAAVLLAATMSRTHGRWWVERRAMSWQFRRRNAAKPVRSLSDTRLAAMQFLAPGLTVEDVTAPDGSHIGVAIDDAGWYAVAEMSAGTSMHSGDGPPLALDRLVHALADADHSGRAVVQLVTHTIPVPESAGPIGDSYHSLLRSSGPYPVPVDRVTWLSVRLDARALAEMGAEHPEQAQAMVAALLRHLVKALRRSGVLARSLDRDALLDALTRSCDLAPADGPPLGDPHEDWDAWYSGRLVHRTYWLQDWPALPRTGALLDALATVPAALTSIAIVLAPTGDTVDVRCLARVATTANRVSAIATAVRECAATASARLLILDGEQGPAAYATAPTGGGPR